MNEWLKVPGERSKAATSGFGAPPEGEIM